MSIQNNVLFKMVEDSNDTYIFFDIKSKNIIAENKIAKTFFTFKDSTINSIFIGNDTADNFIGKSIKLLESENLAYFWDVDIIFNQHKHDKCDIQIGYADDDLESLFISVKSNTYDKFLQMRKFVDLSNKPIFVLNHTDNDFQVYYANNQFYNTIGVDIDTFQEKFNSSFMNLLAFDKREAYIDEISNALVEEFEFSTDIEIQNLSGERLDFYFDVYKISNAYGNNMLYATLISLDKHNEVINELKKELILEKKYFTTMQELSNDIMFKIDVKEKLLIHEPLEAQKFGIAPVLRDFPKSVVSGDIIHPDDLAEYIPFADAMMKGEEHYHKMRIRRIHPITKKSYYEWFEIDSKLFRDEETDEIVEIIGKLASIQDIVTLELKASRDDLTGAFNKVSFRENIVEYFDNQAEKEEETGPSDLLHALLFIDVDDFKYVNDNFGHPYGDFLLKSVVERLQSSIRSDDFVGRVGGDEFAILIKNIPNKDIIDIKLKTIFEKIQKPFTKGDISHNINISIGVALYPNDSTNYDELYDLSDTALYFSKNNGKNISTFYDEIKDR